MNAPASTQQPLAPDVTMTFEWLEDRIEAFKMKPEQLDLIWTVAMAIGHAIMPGDDNYSELIDQHVIEFGRELSPEDVPLILLGDFERVFTNQALIDELQRLFPTLMNDAAKLTCFRFVNRIRRRD